MFHMLLIKLNACSDCCQVKPTDHNMVPNVFFLQTPPLATASAAQSPRGENSDSFLSWYSPFPSPLLPYTLFQSLETLTHSIPEKPSPLPPSIPTALLLTPIKFLNLSLSLLLILPLDSCPNP